MMKMKVRTGDEAEIIMKKRERRKKIQSFIFCNFQTKNKRDKKEREEEQSRRLDKKGRFLFIIKLLERKERSTESRSL